MPMVSYRCDYDGHYFVQIMDHFIFTLWLHHGPYCHIIITETIKKTIQPWTFGSISGE